MRLASFEILRRWLRDEKGVAAVEAAIIAPVAVALLGLIAIWAQAIAIQRKVTLTAHTITDLVSQQGTQTNSACTDPIDNPPIHRPRLRSTSRRSTTFSTTRRTSSTPTSNRIRARTQ